MSSVFSKNKQKRPRSSSNETTSFVANVASRVSSLLPTTITKWFSSPSTSNTNGSAPTAESEDSSTDDDGLDSSIIIPAKRMRFNTDHYNHNEPASNTCSTANFEITETPSTPLPTRRHSGSFKSFKINDSVTNDAIKEKGESDIPRFRSSHSILSTGQSVASIRKSIFEKTNNVMAKKDGISENSSANVAKKPYFTQQGSTFYPGRTVYGGASSSHMNQANIKQSTVAMVNKAMGNEDSAMSSSARRVMDMLESYSSPLREARRIPLYTRPNNRTRELYMPRQASIMRLKQKSRLMNTTQAVRQIIASHSSSTNESSNYPDNNVFEENRSTAIINTGQSNQPRSQIENDKSNNSLKFQTKVTQTNEENIDSMNANTPLKLPSVILKIDQNKLPKFTLDTEPTVSKLPATSTPKVDSSISKQLEKKNNNSDSTSVKKSKIEPCSSIFIFSEPIKTSCDSLDEDLTPPYFTFGSPEQNVSENLGSQSISSENSDNSENKNLAKKVQKNWQCPNCWVSNKAEATECVCCAYKNVKPTKCTSCKISDSQPQKELCVICEKMQLKPEIKPSEMPSKWKCDSCWVMNEASANKCVCCNSPNSSDKGKVATAAETAAFPKVPPIRHGGISFSQVNWSTPAKTSENVLPTSKPISFGTTEKTDGTLIDIAKTQKSNKWECPSCLVMNESNKSMCVCCGTEKESKSKLPEVKFNFGTNSTTTFKFGIDPKVQETKITKIPEIKSTPDVKLTEKSETNNNILIKTPTPSFNLLTKNEEAKLEIFKPKSKDTDGIKFNFGIPKETVTTEKKNELPKVTEDNEKSQEVPQIKLNSIESPKPLGLFASPVIKQNEKDKLIPGPISSSPQTIPEKKDIPSDAKLQQVPVGVENSKPNSTFFLGTSTLKPATNLFSAPGTVLASVTDSIKSSSPAVTTTASTMMLIPTLVQPKSETVTSTASSANKPIIAASLFSFGENVTSNASPLPATTVSSGLTTKDKPSFQFTFAGNTNKTDAALPLLPGSSNTQPVLNSPFGTRDETTKNTNSFGFNAGSVIGSSNAIAPLGGTNGLASNSGLISNNSLGTNSLAGNNGLASNERSNTIAGNSLTGNPLGDQTLTGTSLTTNNLSGNLLAGNTLSSNMFTANNPAARTSVTSAPTIVGINGGLSGNTHAGGNGLQQTNTLNNTMTSGTSNIFGNTVKKDNMWNANNNTSSSNLFVTNKPADNIQKPPAFSFGASGPFNMTNSTPLPFGNNNAQPTQNIFGMGNQNNNNQPSLFTTSIPNQNPAPMFAAPQPASNPAPQMGLFGTQNISTVPAFGTANSSISSFETPSMPSAPPPAFNFGSTVQPTGFFGFGQQQSQPQSQQPSVYSFGGTTPAGPQVQFAMGTAPNTAGRRLRKAVRRTTPR